MPQSALARDADEPSAAGVDGREETPGSAASDRTRTDLAVTDRSPEWAARALWVLGGVAVVFYLWIGRSQWFFQDEWAFLAERDGGDWRDVLRPHNEHWVSVPVVIYRVLWRWLGLRHYEIYQLLPIAAHVGSAGLLWLIMRRAEVGPWIATAAATAFLFFAEVSTDITWAFQVTFMGAVCLGLAHLVLADHEGPVRRRDALGIVVGLLSIMCASTGALMIPVIGFTILVRRGWRPAALHTVPTTAAYLTWALTMGRDVQEQRRAGIGLTLRFTEVGARTALTRFAGSPWLAIVLVLATATGLWLAVQRERWRFVQRAGAPIALLIGAFLMLAAAGANRALNLGADFAEQDRYTHVAIALALPLLAVAVDSLVRRWRRLAVPVCLLLLASIPVDPWGMPALEAHNARPADVLAVAASPYLAQAPRYFQPFPSSGGARAITAGWIQDSVAEGRFPVKAAPPDVQRRADALFTIALDFSVDSAGPCRPFTRPETVVLEQGDAITLRGGAVLYTVAEPGGSPSAVKGAGAVRPYRLVAIRGPLEVWFGPFHPTGVEVCG